ncbi:hypothetical protein HI914_06894 [Erysiphe necator]|nr:hypothetical protein HI914_06894 [Erysiphe necator]
MKSSLELGSHTRRDLQSLKILDHHSREDFLRDIPLLRAHRSVVKSSEVCWKVSKYKAELVKVRHKLGSILEELKERRKLMIEREKHINTIIENLILSQNPITDSIKQNTGNSTIVKIPDKHKNKNNTETSKILDSSNRASEIEVLEESKMAGLEKRSGDFAGAEMPSLSVLPIINVTPFSGKDQDAGRWIAVLESKFIQAGFNSLEDVPGWM